MFKEFFTKAGIAGLLSKVRIGGETVDSHIKQSRANTIKGLKSLFKRSVMADAPADAFTAQLGKAIKTRKRHTLNTLRNLMSTVRGQARAIASTGRKGKWFNRGILDGKTTAVCAGYMGASWDIPYSQIPDKPPRVAITPHPCRSYLTFSADGQDAPDETPFMEQFNGSEELQLDLLGSTEFEAIKSGALPPIKSFADYERRRLLTHEDLGLKQ